MISQYNTESWRDDIEPGVHPTIAHAIHHLRTGRAIKLVNDRLWPFPATAIPPDGTKPPQEPPKCSPS